ncbi:MAG: AMP-binding protein, partial [Myxococcota bacterium]
PCPVYTTNLAEQVGYIVRHSGSRIIMIDDQTQLDKVESPDFGAEVDHVVGFGALEATRPDLLSLGELEEKWAAQTHEDALHARLAETQLDDSPLRVYTSGTTGLPKGAELTHRGIKTVVDGILELYGEPLRAREQRGVSYLPLCHAAEQIFTNFLALNVGARTYFCPDLSELKDYLVKVRPTYLLGVPRVWEKLQAALLGQLAQASGFKKSLATWALATEAAATRRELETRTPARGVRRAVARGLVVNKIRDALGISDVDLAFSGAAPLSTDTANFFQGLGVVLHEAYGMTETTGVATLPPFRQPKLGTVGQPMKGVEVRISDEGEIQLRGQNMVRSYHRLPEKTAELWDGEWMRTGDLGAFDDDGYLRITGRMKDLIITAGGKNVGPVGIEGLLTKIPGIGQAVAVGDKKPFLCALLVIDPENLAGLLEGAGVKDTLTAAQAARDPKVLEFVRTSVETVCNAKLARYQQIKYFELLADPFTVESGELTPTMKLKRHVVNEKFSGLIESLYADRSRVAS